MSIDVSAINGTQTPHIQSQHNQTMPLHDKQPVAAEITAKPEISINEVLQELSQVSAVFDKRLAFTLNDKIGQVVVKVIDTKTDTIIREIPAVELQRVHEHIKEVLGILFDERV